jgi:hypothetical protein
MNYELILTAAIGLTAFGGGYLWGYKRALRKALIDPRHDCIMAAFHLVLLKKLDEKDYDAVRGGIQMRARQYVIGYREYKNTLSKKQLKKLQEIVCGYELVENAEELCGSLEPVDIDEIMKSLGVSE